MAVQEVSEMGNLEQVISIINKEFGGEVVTKGTHRVYVEKIPFNSPRVNYLTYGGIPVGKSTEFFGEEGSGKTTSALVVVASAQRRARRLHEEELSFLSSELEQKLSKTVTKQHEERKAYLEKAGPRKAVYVDTENSLDEEWARVHGVDTEEMVLIRPQDQTAEEVLQMMLDILKTGDVEILVLDSIPMLIPQQLYDENLDKKSYAGASAPLTQFASRVSAVISKHRTAMILINQMREDMNNPYNIYHTPGGRALKHLYGLRLFFRKGTYINIKNEELTRAASTEPAGNMVDVHVAKTKVCKPDRRIGQYTLKYHSGVDVLADTVYMAIKYNIIVQSGSWYSLISEDGEVLESNEGALKFQGMPKLLDYLHSDEDTFKEIYDAVGAKLIE